MKEIKDYLYLYLGCEVQTNYSTGRLLEINTDGWVQIDYADKGIAKPNIGNITIKPILRQLSDMSEKEFTEVCGFGKYDDFMGKINNGTITFGFEETKYLLSKHFDLFGLIEAGLAIDATKINVPT